MDSQRNERVDHLVVLGGGTAGFISAITCRSKMRNLRVTLVRSREIGIIGVGEGTTPVVPSLLHGYLNLDPAEFYKRAEPTWKLGVRFLWGPFDHYNYTFSLQFGRSIEGLTRRSGFYALKDPHYVDSASSLMEEDRVFLQNGQGIPLIGKDLAYHLENQTFVSYLEQVAKALGVSIIEDKVVDVDLSEEGVTAVQLEERGRLAGDLFVDASGFRSALLGEALEEPYVSYGDSLFCDRAVAGGWERGPDEPIKPYTTSETMDSGWCWQVELEKRINRGYVYSSGFISDDEAESEFRKLNPNVGDTRVVKFTSGRRERAWVKNVVGIGNASGFVEPLESTSLGVICADSQALVAALIECDRRPNESMRWQHNDRCRRVWDTIRNFLSIHYRFNKRCSTEFWRACNEKVDLHEAERIVDYYRENGPSALWGEYAVDKGDQFKIEGYVAHLMGLGAPCEWNGSISEEEWKRWQVYRSKMKQAAQNGLTVDQALKVVKSDSWKWAPGFYR